MENNQKTFTILKLRCPKVFGGVEESRNVIKDVFTFTNKHTSDTMQMTKIISEYYNTSFTELEKINGYEIMDMFENILINAPKKD